MQRFLDTARNEEREFGPTFEKYFFLHRDKASTIVKKSNYFTTLAAIRELEKVELCRQLDNVYGMDHAEGAAERRTNESDR